MRLGCIRNSQKTIANGARVEFYRYVTELIKIIGIEKVCTTFSSCFPTLKFIQIAFTKSRIPSTVFWNPIISVRITWEWFVVIPTHDRKCSIQSAVSKSLILEFQVFLGFRKNTESLRIENLSFRDQIVIRNQFTDYICPKWYHNNYFHGNRVDSCTRCSSLVWILVISISRIAKFRKIGNRARK